MAAPTSTNEVTARKLSASVSALWAKIKSTFQTLGNLVTAWGSTPSDTKYPSEKLVKTSLNSSVLYANQKWGGAFRASLSPLDTYFILNKNYFLGVAANCVSVEYSTDGGSTWLDYGLTDLQKRNLFNQFATVDVYCGKNTHIQPGYTGSITGTKDLTDDIIANQRLRITISSRPFGNAGTTSRTGEWMICSQMRRFAIYMSTQSASSKTHCKVQSRAIANFCSGTNTWVDHGDYPIVGDSGWNSIPIGNDSAEGGFGFGSYDSVSTTNRSEFRFEIWSEKLNTNPASSQTGNLCIKTICSIADKLSTTTSKFRSILYNGLCCTGIDMENGWPVFGNGIKFTARKLKTNLARTADSTFDGSADQTNIPVTGTLPVANGGTGKSSVTAGNYLVGNGTSALTEKTPNVAANDLINALSTGESTPTGEDYYVAQYAGGGTTTKTYHRRPVKALWEYIKSQISSVLGLTATSYGGNAATATAAQNYDTSTGTIKTALAGKSDTSHTHVADANDVTNNTAGSDLSEVTDSTEFVTTNIGGYSSSDKKLYRRPFGTKIWPWIKSKLGISSAVGSSTLPVYFDSNGQAKAIGSDLQIVKGSSDSEASVRAMYDGNNKIYLCSNSTTNGIAMYNGGTFKWMCSSDRNGNATFNGNANTATNAAAGGDLADAVSKKHSHSSLTLSTTAQTYDGSHTLALPSSDPYSSARTPTAHNHAASDITSGTFGTSRIADDAITADKVKDNETLPVNISGVANSSNYTKWAYGISVDTDGNSTRRVKIFSAYLPNAWSQSVYSCIIECHNGSTNSNSGNSIILMASVSSWGNDNYHVSLTVLDNNNWNMTDMPPCLIVYPKDSSNYSQVMFGFVKNNSLVSFERMLTTIVPLGYSNLGDTTPTRDTVNDLTGAYIWPAKNKPVSAGSANQPVYFSNGVPTVCNWWVS